MKDAYIEKFKNIKNININIKNDADKRFIPSIIFRALIKTIMHNIVKGKEKENKSIFFDRDIKLRLLITKSLFEEKKMYKIIIEDKILLSGLKSNLSSTYPTI